MTRNEPQKFRRIYQVIGTLTCIPRKGLEEDKYFEHISSTWTACNILHGTYVSNRFLYEKIRVSFLNYQASKYIEVIGRTLIDLRLSEELSRTLSTCLAHIQSRTL